MNSEQLAKFERRTRHRWKYIWVWLVVVALFAVVLIPVFNQAEQRMGPHPLNHLQSTALACLMYASENDDRLPPSATWVDSVMPYAKNEFVFKDRAIEDREDDEFGIAFYRPLSTVEVKSVLNSEEIPLTFQSSLLHRNAASNLSTLPHPPRHDGSYRVSFLDGRARTVDEGWPSEPIKIEYVPASGAPE